MNRKYDTMPNEPVHKMLFSVLDSFSREYFIKNDIYFLGGASLVLSNAKEYRISNNLDFGCSNPDAFRKVYNEIKSTGATAFCTSGKISHLLVHRDSPVVCERGTSCKLFFDIMLLPKVEKIATIRCEIVLETRLEFSPSKKTVFGFPTVDENDFFATKLLANSDRWRSLKTLYRDVFDIFALLDAMKLKEIPRTAVEKAQKAYFDAENQYVAALKHMETMDKYPLDSQTYSLGKSVPVGNPFNDACSPCGLHVNPKKIPGLRKRLEQQLLIYDRECLKEPDTESVGR